MASKEEVVAKVKDPICQSLGVSDAEIALDSSFIDDLGADSLDIVELVMLIEDSRLIGSTGAPGETHDELTPDERWRKVAFHSATEQLRFELAVLLLELEMLSIELLNLLEKNLLLRLPLRVRSGTDRSTSRSAAWPALRVRCAI